MENTYQYQQVPEGHIRVLTLHASREFEDPLWGHLEVFPVEKSSNYAALSYSWGMNADGDATLNREIIISGKPLLITQNLFEGLRRMRSRTISRRLWVDAICIKQSDDPERSAQVARMADVFRCASHLIVWLGEGESEEQDAMAHNVASCDTQNQVRDMRPIFSSIQADGASVNVHKALLLLLSLENEVFFGEAGPEFKCVDQNPCVISTFQSIIEAVLQFYSRRYWERRWIVQELLHYRAGSYEVRWGHCIYQHLWRLVVERFSTIVMCSIILERRSEDKIPELQAWLHDRADSINEASEVNSRIFGLDPEWYLFPMSLHAFLDNLRKFVKLQCTDDRDRLFALLSLCPELNMQPDYSMSMEQVCVSFAHAMIQHGRFNELLEYLKWEEFEDGVERLADLPSWAPDLRSSVVIFRTDYCLARDAEATSDATIIDVEFCTYGRFEVADQKGLRPAGIQLWDQHGCPQVNMTPLTDEDIEEVMQDGDLVCGPFFNFDRRSGASFCALRTGTRHFGDEPVYRLYPIWLHIPEQFDFFRQAVRVYLE